MFDKYKRYRERKKDHRIALKMDVELLLKEVSGLPAVCAEASATLGRERKVVALPTRPVASGDHRFGCTTSTASDLHCSYTMRSITSRLEQTIWYDASTCAYETRCTVSIASRTAAGKVSWPSTVAFSCTVYRDAVQAGSCEPKVGAPATLSGPGSKSV